MLESRDCAKTINYSNDVIRDASGFEVGVDVRMKVFKNDAIKSWYENTMEQTLDQKNTDSKIQDSSEIFDKKQNLTETPFFCNEILTDSYQKIPLKNPEIFDYEKAFTFKTSNGSSTSILPQNDALPSLTHPQNPFPKNLFPHSSEMEINEDQKVNCVFCGQVYAQKKLAQKALQTSAF